MYKLGPNGSGYVIRLSDNEQILCNPIYPEYQDYLQWMKGYARDPMGWRQVSEGNEPLPADE